MVAALIAVALVVYDQAPLRAAPQDGAARQATLWQGEWLEVRGERQGFLQVYDHRRERPGYVRDWQVRVYALDEATAPQLRTLVDFLKDTPGAEALGIGYAAAYLRAAPAGQVGPDLFDALGTLADRLARRASQASGKPNDPALAAHLDVAASYGVKLVSFEREGRTQVCYDGEAFRRVLALGGSPEARARAALALTREACIDPALEPVALQELNAWRGQVLEQVDASRLAPYLANRLRLRRAEVSAVLAYDLTRRGEAGKGAQASAAAVETLASVDKAELAEDDRPAYAAAAVRVAASRWAGEPVPPPAAGGPALESSDGKPGETCLRLVDPEQPKAPPLAERCTYGKVWMASVRRSPRRSAVAVQVQMLESWTELWVFHRDRDGWRLDTLSPGTTGPGLGYAELAGWSPDGTRILIARETRVDGHIKSAFEIIRLDTLEPVKSVETAGMSGTFQRWSSADWRGHTLALR